MILLGLNHAHASYVNVWNTFDCCLYYFWSRLWHNFQIIAKHNYEHVFWLNWHRVGHDWSDLAAAAAAAAWIKLNILLTMSLFVWVRAVWLDYCPFEFAYLLSLLMRLVGGSRNQINALSKELAKGSHKFPLIRSFLSFKF